MLSNKETEFLDKKYPLISSAMFLFLIPTLVLILIFAFFYTRGRFLEIERDVLIMIEALIFLVSSIGFLVFVAFLSQRYQVRKRCIAVTNGLAIRVERTAIGSHSDQKIRQFAREIVIYDVVGMILKTLSSSAAVPSKKNVPMIFVTVRELEEMYLEYPEHSFSAHLKFRTRGIRREQWVEIVWSGFRSRARKSLLYEVAFVILGTSKAKYNQERRHAIIRDSGVEYILEAERQ